eukprot:COSAG04_NODE_1399_length_6927_cov_9.052285_2_plen_419_part_00
MHLRRQASSAEAKGKSTARLDALSAQLTEQAAELERLAGASASAATAAAAAAGSDAATAAFADEVSQTLTALQERLASGAEELSAVKSELAQVHTTLTAAAETHETLQQATEDNRAGTQAATTEMHAALKLIAIAQDDLKKEHGSALEAAQLERSKNEQRIVELSAGFESGAVGGGALTPHDVHKVIHDNLHGTRVNFAQLVLGARIWRGQRTSTALWTTPTFVQPHPAGAHGSSAAQEAYLSLFDMGEENAAEHTIDGSGGRILGNCWAMEHLNDPSDRSASSGTITVGLGQAVVVVRTTPTRLSTHPQLHVASLDRQRLGRRRFLSSTPTRWFRRTCRQRRRWWRPGGTRTARTARGGCSGNLSTRRSAPPPRPSGSLLLSVGCGCAGARRLHAAAASLPCATPGAHRFPRVANRS